MSWVADIFAGVAKFMTDVIYVAAVVAAASLLLNVLFVPLLIVAAGRWPL
ncbi:hypothetical protein [Microcystis aeruginosa]|jgi:hypothetical protein|uniref:Uncharacterized protein n=1 Tax=Microcystis aeruginosa FD4 TaxID=2686288 RepID=A0A857DAA3_MICAE|nr:hypothetical protein [Microcystis aeruginosa]MDB9422832.1 hypothetical protein [Microcystis aeruginosa CS-563/04]NCR07957.1 hypothetical protein [Microcystis aeruginosa LG13-11]QGZ92557.1 hypothetical protein GQR42_26785 [Microcystis aeruginosa FD4]